MGSLLTDIINGVTTATTGTVMATGIITYIQRLRFRANKRRIIKNSYFELLYYLDPIKTKVTNEIFSIPVIINFMFLQSIQEVMIDKNENDLLKNLALISKTSGEFNSLNSFLKMMLSSNDKAYESDLFELVQEGLNYDAAILQSLVGKVIMELQDRWPDICPFEDEEKLMALLHPSPSS